MPADVQNPTTMSDYDWLEFVSFAWKVEREGYRYAVENYGPEFEDKSLPTDGPELRALFKENRRKVDEWWDVVGGEAACDMQNNHVDEARQRGKDACLWGLRCTDDYVIHQPSQERRDRTVAELLSKQGKGSWRVPAALLHRDEPGGEWTESPLPA